MTNTAALDELEQALAAEWSRDNLAVYGDLLQSLGDPRGELIAIDLAGGDAMRKRDLAIEWLGEDLATTAHHIGSIEHAFVHIGQRAPYMAAYALDELLAHPAGRYLRELAIDDSRMLEVYALLAAEPRRWLVRLEVPCPTSIAERDALGRALVEMPLLRDLVVDPPMPPAMEKAIVPASVRVSYPTS